MKPLSQYMRLHMKLCMKITLNSQGMQEIVCNLDIPIILFSSAQFANLSEMVQNIERDFFMHKYGLNAILSYHH